MSNVHSLLLVIFYEKQSDDKIKQCTSQTDITRINGTSRNKIGSWKLVNDVGTTS
jgi:hypothetical protein